MLFKPEHIRMILEGKKTATRRLWKRWAVKVEGVYPVQTQMFQTKEECDVFIRVTDRYKQELGEMTEEDAKKEGGYTLDEFKERWEEITGQEFDPEQVAYVIEFEKVVR